MKSRLDPSVIKLMKNIKADRLLEDMVMYTQNDKYCRDS